jgi:hypothetical protein
MKWATLRFLAYLVGKLILAIDLLRAIAGGLRFFLLTGASPRALLERRHWFESTMLGRRIGVRDLLEFGSWHADTVSHNRLDTSKRVSGK